MVQAQYFLQDLKLGHYLKVPPKPMFFAQSGMYVHKPPNFEHELNYPSGDDMECHRADSSYELGTRKYQRVPIPAPLPHNIPPSLIISSICTPDQPGSYTCPGGNVFFTASVIWGAIGPRRIFSPGSLYSPLLWYFFLGAVLPFVTYFAARRWPKSPAK